MKPKVIKTDAEYEAALARIERPLRRQARHGQGRRTRIVAAPDGDVRGADIPDGPTRPDRALRFRMEQQGLKAKDLIPYLGGKSRVSEVLHGRRPLSLTMIRNLVTGLGLPPEVALGQTPNRRPRRVGRGRTRPVSTADRG